MVKQGAGSVECDYCGTEIRETAHKCHNCGTENKSRETVDISATDKPHNPEEYDTNASDVWIKVLSVAVFVFIVGVIITFLTSAATFGPLLYGVAWVVMIAATYYDIEYVRANSTWYPSKGLWLIGMFLIVINIGVAVIYFYKRKEALSQYSRTAQG